jgi:hypothetical protein
VDAFYIHLGYEIGTGEPVSIPLQHLAVTGQTQRSGKTTALEAPHFDIKVARPDLHHQARGGDI